MYSLRFNKLTLLKKLIYILSLKVLNIVKILVIILVIGISGKLVVI